MKELKMQMIMVLIAIVVILIFYGFMKIGFFLFSNPLIATIALLALIYKMLKGGI